MYALAPRSPSASTLPIFLNVGLHVGPGQSNAAPDVMLVQLGLQMMGQYPSTSQPMPAEVKQQLLAVRVTGNCDAYTVSTIRAYQQWRKLKYPGQTVDGIVSPSTGGYGYGGGTNFTIVELCVAMKRAFASTWPAIQLDDKCPPALKPHVAKAVTGDAV